MYLVRHLAFCVAVLLLMACGREEVSPKADPATGEANILDVQVGSTLSKGQSHQISVTIHKPTPCHKVKDTKITSSGTTVSYDFILEATAEICAQVIEEEVVQVSFDPKASGVYTLNFLIDGRHYKSQQVTVGD